MDVLKNLSITAVAPQKMAKVELSHSEAKSFGCLCSLLGVGLRALFEAHFDFESLRDLINCLI
jgi:hypothetical protein